MNVSQIIKSGYSNVGDIRIKYQITQDMGASISMVRANIETEDKRIGDASIYRDGRIYINIGTNNDTSFSIMSEVLGQLLTDAKEIFTEATQNV